MHSSLPLEEHFFSEGKKKNPSQLAAPYLPGIATAATEGAISKVGRRGVVNGEQRRLLVLTSQECLSVFPWLAGSDPPALLPPITPSTHARAHARTHTC